MVGVAPFLLFRLVDCIPRSECSESAEHQPEGNDDGQDDDQHDEDDQEDVCEEQSIVLVLDGLGGSGGVS